MAPAVRAASSRRVLAISLLVDLLDVVTNLIVALLTGSAVVFAEMAQGLADAGGSAMLVFGERRSRRARDAEHPLGYSREAFFWTLLSAVTMLVVGAGLSAWRGYHQLVDPEPLASPPLAFAVLTLSILTNGYAVGLSARKLIIESGSLRGAFRRQDQPLVKSALLRDAIGTSTSVLGMLALALYIRFDIVAFDALGALGAAVFMTVASLMLMGQARALITGQSLPMDTVELLSTRVSAMPGVERVNRLVALYTGASKVLIVADLDLVEDLETARIESILDEVEARIRSELPEASRVTFQLNSPDGSGGVPPIA